MGNPDNLKHFDNVSMRVSFRDSLIQCTASTTFISFDQHVPIEDDTDEWENNLIESHLAETPTETTSDSEDDQINDNEQSDTERLI
jgi:hypothetical protein